MKVSRNYLPFFLVILFNTIVILFVYGSVFRLEFEGDSWFYGWGHQVYYGSNVFSPLSLKGMRSSLGGASLTFGLIQNAFGLYAVVYYTISVVVKILSVVVFYVLINKLTKSFMPSFIASLLLAMTAVGVEATHWVFNMYAYIGLIFIMISIITCIELPTKFTVKRWLLSFLSACTGVWYATMRTNGVIPLILFWSFYQLLTLRTRSSKLNFAFWVIGIIVFILVDKFILGQMESDYSRKYIINQGLQAFKSQIEIYKYDFLFAPTSNLGLVMFPDTIWSSFNFPKVFSFLGSGVVRTVILPSFLIFVIFSWILSRSLSRTKNEIHSWSSVYYGKFWLNSSFLLIFELSLLWTLAVYFVLKLSPVNFPSWENLTMALFGGFFIISCIFLVTNKNVPTHLKNLFLITGSWSLVFLLLPTFQNGGAVFGTYHRYMVTTAPAVPMYIAGLLSLSLVYKSLPLQIVLFLVIIPMFFYHATSAKAFFDRKAVSHNREVSRRIWRQFQELVPNKPQYLTQPPAIFFEAADNPVDQDTLFESLAFGYDFRADLFLQWPHNQQTYIYNNGNFKDLILTVKKNPEILNEFYAVKVEDQRLINITDEVKRRIVLSIQQ